MKILRFFAIIPVIAIIFTFTSYQPGGLTEKEGYIKVTGGEVWYKITGKGSGIPVLLLHGGPGIPSFYLNPLSALGDERPVIFFDQLGCGRSEFNKDTSLWKTDVFVNQLEEIVNALGLKEFYLFGHSWGTMLAVDYYLSHPSGIKGLILSGASLSIPLWGKDANELLATLPDSTQTVINKCEKERNYDSQEYNSAVNVFYQMYVARKLPWSADIDTSFSQANMKLYEYMCGHSEFTTNGTLKSYDRTADLNKIKTPTLFIVGEYDEARPATVKYFQSLVPGSEFEIIPGAAHLEMQDQPEAFVYSMRKFLKKTDGGE